MIIVLINETNVSFSVSLCQTVENKTPELRKWQFPNLGITIQ